LGGKITRKLEREGDGFSNLFSGGGAKGQPQTLDDSNSIIQTIAEKGGSRGISRKIENGINLFKSKAEIRKSNRKTRLLEKRRVSGEESKRGQKKLDLGRRTVTFKRRSRGGEG